MIHQSVVPQTVNVRGHGTTVLVDMYRVTEVSEQSAEERRVQSRPLRGIRGN